MGNAARRDQRAAELAENQNRALQLRREGFTFDQIATEMHIRKSHAWNLVRNAIRAIPMESAEEVRTLELDRLDAILRGGLYQKALKGDPRAVLTFVRVADQRAKLCGLYPTAINNVAVIITADKILSASDSQLERLAKGESPDRVFGVLPAASPEQPDVIDVMAEDEPPTPAQVADKE